VASSQDAGRRRHEFGLAAFLILIGLGSWLHWSLANPSFNQTDSQSDWANVLAFSALVFALMAGAGALGRALSSAASVRRLTLALFAAGSLAALTNIVEDGLGVEKAFLAFALLTGFQLLALITLAIALGLSVGGPRRLLALAPLASAAGLLAYVNAGGPILLATWCIAGLYLVATRPTACDVTSP
jgi:hypothetical protein